MQFQLREIVLWPRRAGLEPRRVRFEPGRVNVISGGSRTGKSAIIPIVDYCLGSEKCTIPVATIRDACSWFGIVIETRLGQKLLARREPGQLRATGDMFLSEGSSVEVPKGAPSRNTTVDAVKRSLDELAGLSQLNFEADEAARGFAGRVSFRDLVAFMFQPQNVVANPNVLFYKTDSYEHKEKLKAIFPYVLGAVTPEILAKRHELVEVRRNLRKKEQELKSVQQVTERWRAEILARVARARELGLIPQGSAQPVNTERAIELLRGVISSAGNETRVTETTVSRAVSELTTLQQEESQVSQELSGLRRRLAEMSQLRSTAADFRGALEVQRDRLKVSEWVSGLKDGQHICPICKSPLDGATSELDVLTASLKEVEQTATQFERVPAAFDREFERVRSAIGLAAERLSGIQGRRRALEQRSREARERQFGTVATARFVGNLESDVRTYESVRSDGDLQSEVRELRNRVAQLEKEISEEEIRRRVDRALGVVDLNAGRLIPDLDAERPNDPVSLSLTELSVKVGGRNREDFLWEIGSGSNWLSYHIAISLALQQFFLNLGGSPVPSLLVYDQPSQVYFPKRLVERQSDSDPELQLKDEDVEAVRKVFDVLAKVVRTTAGALQVVVLDHAAANVWGDIQDVHAVEDWREGRKLVPEDWLASS